MDTPAPATTWLVNCEVQIPYPKRFEYRVTGSTFHVAAARAGRMLRKDLPRKRIDQVVIKITRIA